MGVGVEMYEFYFRVFFHFHYNSTFCLFFWYTIYIRIKDPQVKLRGIPLSLTWGDAGSTIMKKIKVGINGFGRIGRAFLKIAFERPEVEIVAVNDLGDIANMAYLLKYDTVYREWNHDIKVEGDSLMIDGKKVKVLAQKDPSLLPWKDLNIDVVVESTGLFTTYEKSKVHLDAGAKKVVISAPAKEGDGTVQGETILLGVNEEKFGTCDITSNASCTTNAASPLIAILHEAVGIEKAILNTVHGYTASQALVDGPNKKDLREGRAAAQNIVPSSTGAAIAVTKAFPELEGLFDGISIRVPVISRINS